MAVFPLASMVNHSCEPCLDVHFPLGEPGWLELARFLHSFFQTDSACVAASLGPGR